MHHFFMLVVILALLPFAIQTAAALGVVLFYLFLGVIAIGIFIFLIQYPILLMFVIIFAGGYGIIYWTNNATKQ